MSHWKNTIFSILGTFDDSIRFYLVLLFLLGICHVCRKPCISFPWSTLSVRSSRPKPSTEPGAQLLNFSLMPALSDLLLIRNASLRPGHVRRATCTGPLGPMCSTETKGINLPGLAKNYRFSFRHTIWHCTFELVLHRMIPFMETVKESKTQHLKENGPSPGKDGSAWKSWRKLLEPVCRRGFWDAPVWINSFWIGTTLWIPCAYCHQRGFRYSKHCWKQ